MLSYFVLDGFPFVSLLACSFFPHPNNTGDEVGPGRLTGLRDFVEMAFGLFETADILRTIRLSRASFEWPCDRRSSNRNEIASFHSSTNFRSDTIPRW